MGPLWHCKQQQGFGRYRQSQLLKQRSALTTLRSPWHFVYKPGNCHALSRLVEQAGTSADGWPLDPRTPELGQRTILPKSAEGALELPPADPGQYRQWRHSLGIAEGSSEIPPGAHSSAYGVLGFKLHCIFYTQKEWRCQHQCNAGC